MCYQEGFNFGWEKDGCPFCFLPVAHLQVNFNIIQQLDTLTDELIHHKHALSMEKEKSEGLLFSILPQSVAEQLIDGKQVRKFIMIVSVPFAGHERSAQLECDFCPALTRDRSCSSMIKQCTCTLSHVVVSSLLARAGVQMQQVFFFFFFFVMHWFFRVVSELMPGHESQSHLK